MIDVRKDQMIRPDETASLKTVRTPGQSSKNSLNMPKLTPVLKPRRRLKNGVISMTRGGAMTTLRISHFVA